MTHPKISLADGQRLLRMNDTELRTRYFALGGNGTVTQMRDHVVGPTCPDAHEHNIIAQALNDVFVEQGCDHPVAYRHLFGDESDG